MGAMDAELVKELNEEMGEGVRALVALCNAHDHTSYDPELEGDFYYLVRNDDPEESGVKEALFSVLSGYLLGETVDGMPVLEVEAFTHPKMRGCGMFRLCYRSLLDDFRGYRIRFMIKRPQAASDAENDGPAKGIELSDDAFPTAAVPFVAPDTYEVLHALGAVHQYDELLMTKELARPIDNPGDSLSEKYGEVHLTPFSADTLYLYGLLVYDPYLRQGHGRALMRSAEDAPKDGPYRRILLQVSSSNIAALHLYESLGYQETERILYFLVTV